MSFLEYLHLVITDYTLRTITLGTLVLGATCGILGSFAVLKKQSLLGDAISHAALPGIAIAFLLTGTKNTNVLLLGALISGLLGSFWIRNIIKKTQLKTDTALGLTLSIFFGFGMLLLTYIQKLPNANQSGLEDFIFGQAATLMVKDVILISSVMTGSLVVLLFFWKELKLLLFDAEYAQTLGFNTKYLDILIISFIVIAIVLGLQTVGVVLMSAMLIAPAAAARQWTDKLGTMVIIAALIGGISGVIGTGISATQSNLSTGPVIVLVAFIFVFVSFIFSPNRGLLFKRINNIKNRRYLEQHKLLVIMSEISKENPNSSQFPITELINKNKVNKKNLVELKQRELITINNNNWSLTKKGTHFLSEELYTKKNN